MSAIADNLQAVQARISNAAAAVGRSPESVRLLAVSKTWPLACVLEGGTWAAGRVLASRLRGGTPPLNIESDGTIF